MDSWDRFEEKRLPSKDEFYSKLNMSGISEKDYQHACKVWNEFDLKNMGDCHDLYLKTDVTITKNDLILNSTPENRLQHSRIE